jgi:hypothetical protein
MKGFGKLILISGLAIAAFLAWEHAWNILFGKSIIEEQTASIEEAVKTAAEASKKSEKNSGGTNIDRDRQKDKKSEENVNTDIVEPAKRPIDNQYKNSEVNDSKDAHQVAPEFPTESGLDTIVRSRKRKREDPFKDVVFQTPTPTRINQSEFSKKNTENKNLFANKAGATKTSIPKSRNTKIAQKKASETISLPPLEEDTNTAKNTK